MRDRLSYMYLSLGGRIRRRDYWLFFVLPALVLGGLFYEADAYRTVVMLIVLWPAIAVQAKRWHDQDFAAWWVLVNLIPVVGWGIALVLNGLAPGSRGENQYGPDPRN